MCIRAIRAFILCFMIAPAFAVEKSQITQLHPEFEQGYRYSSAVRVGCTLYVGGFVSIDEQGSTVGVGDVAMQTTQIYASLQRVLEANGMSLNNMVQETLFLVDLTTLEAAGGARASAYEKASVKNYPSTAGVGVTALSDPSYLIELQGIASNCGN